MVMSGIMEDGLTSKWNVWIRSGFQQNYQAVEVSNFIPLKYLIFSHLVLERKCGQTVPTPFQGMDITWPYKRRELGIDAQHPSYLHYIMYIFVIFKEMKSFTPVQTIMKHGLRDIQVNLPISLYIALPMLIITQIKKWLAYGTASLIQWCGGPKIWKSVIVSKKIISDKIMIL